MSDINKSKQQLIDELATLRTYVSELEAEQANSSLSGTPKTMDEDVTLLLKELAVLAEIGQTITSSLDIDGVYERFAREVRKLIEFDDIAITLIDGDSFAVAYSLMGNIPDRPRGIPIPLAGSNTYKVAQDGVGFVIDLDDEDSIAEKRPGLLPIFRAGHRSIVTAPLFSDGACIGVLHITSKTPKCYGTRDLKIAERVANQIAGSIANSKLYTELMQAEAKLRANELRLKSIVNEIPTPILITHISDGKILYANKHSESLFGLTVEEIIGRLVTEFFVDVDDRLQILEELQTSGKIRDREIRGKKSDGTDFWVTFSSQPTTFNGHKAIVTGIHDTTERRKAQEALQESESRFRTLAETTPAGIFIYQGPTIRYANPGAKTITGYSYEEMVGREFWFYVHTDHVEEVKSTWLKQQQPGETFPGRQEVKILTKSGEVRWLDYAGVTIDMDGKAAVLCTVLDITEIKQVEEELRIRNRALTATTSNGVTIFDASSPDLPIIYCNSAFERISGYVLEETLGQNYAFLQGDGTDIEVAMRIQSAVREGRGCKEILLNYRKDGTPFWNDLTISPVRDEDDRLTHFVAVQEDTTEHKELVQQLQQSQKMEAVGQLAGGIAHDFNNLLSIIMSYTHLCTASLPYDSHMNGYLKEVQKASEKAAHLTNQLLAFSRRSNAKPQPVDLNELILDLEKMLQRLISENINLSINLDTNLGETRADPNQMEQVLVNLIVNARDAMPNGGAITIQTSNVSAIDRNFAAQTEIEDGDYILLAVSDTGEGILEEAKPHIFEPFFTTKEQGKGTGLGLSTCYGIVTQSGGHIHVRSEEGKGTTFSIFLPKIGEQHQPVPIRDESSCLPVGNETVMIVEDDDQVRDVVTRLMRQQGYNVLEASNGKKAVDLLEEHAGENIHLLLTDIIMPQMSGKQLVEYIKGTHPETVVIYTSGYIDEDSHNGYSNKFEPDTLFIQKPFKPTSIIRTVREFLDSQSSTRSA